MKVLLTRPEGRNQLMEAALSTRNVAFMTAPLLQINPTSQCNKSQIVKTLDQADIIIFVSTNAVKFTAHFVNDLHAKTATFYAIGEATHAQLQSLGLNAQQAPFECQQTEGLLSLTSLQHVHGKNIAIVRGVGGREDLATALKQRQAHVTYCEVYQRAYPTFNPNTLCQQWRTFGIDTIIITSGDILDNLIKTVPNELFAWLQTCHIIVPSSRVYEKAIAYGLISVTNAKAANTHAMLNAMSL